MKTSEFKIKIPKGWRRTRLGEKLIPYGYKHTYKDASQFLVGRSDERLAGRNVLRIVKK